jgi:hypothetical protein
MNIFKYWGEALLPKASPNLMVVTSVVQIFYFLIYA